MTGPGNLNGLSAIEAERLGQLQRNDAHMVLALITEGASVPIRLLSEWGVDLDALREDLLDALQAPRDERAMYTPSGGPPSAQGGAAVSALH